MAFQFNTAAYDRGAAIVGDYYKKERQDELDALAEEKFGWERQRFQNEQADRAYYQENSDRFGTGLAGVGNPNESATGRMLQSIGQRGEGLGPEFAQYEQGYQPPAAQQNPAVNNSATAPNAVTDNVATPRGVQPHVAAFVRQYGPMAEVAAKRLGVSPDAVLGQWGQETGWGTKVIPGTNNLGNIKSTDGTGVRATDNATGSRDLYRAYPTPEAGANGYADFISGNQKRYGAALNTGDNSQAFFAGLKVGGYAEDPDYVRKGVAATDMVRSARGVAPSGVQSQAVSRRNAAPAAPAEEVAQQPTGLQPPQAAPSNEMGQQQPQQQPAGIRPIQARADPRMEQYKIIAQAAMRKGDMATASRAAELYHSVRLDSEMGAISSSVMQMTPTQLNELATRMGGDVNTGLRGMLLESKFDPATGMSTVSIGDKKIQLSRTDMAQMVGGLYAIEKGAVDAGYKQIAAVNKTIADLAAQQNDLTLKTTKEGNDVAERTARMENDTTRLTEQGRHNAAVEGNQQTQVNRPHLVQMVNEKNELVFVDQNKLKTDVNGMAIMPAGIRPMKQPQQLSDGDKIKVAQYYKALENAPANMTPAQYDQMTARYGVAHLIGIGKPKYEGWAATESQGQSAPAQSQPTKATGVRQPVNLAPVGQVAMANNGQRQPTEQRIIDGKAVVRVLGSGTGVNVEFANGSTKYMDARSAAMANLYPQR